jgi:hypothetical protein
MVSSVFTGKRAGLGGVRLFARAWLAPFVSLFILDDFP